MNLNRFIILIFIFSSTAFFVGCGEKKTEQKKSEQPKTEKKESIVREDEIIDLAAIDTNKDGMVFECPMDWNVIDDKPNSCPTCGMDLEEYTIAQAKENLVRNDYKVK